jgi:pimeloyl-ACP methyl ester carboxylesterase
MAVFTDHLSHAFQTLTPDLRGYGQSQQQHPFSMSAHLNDLEQLLGSLTEPCLVLGWSLGGILALELALRSPEAIRGLILIATAAHPRSDHPPISWQDNLFTGLAGITNWLTPAAPWIIETLGKRSLFRYLLQQHTSHAYRRLAREGVSAYLETSTLATLALNTAIRQGYNQTTELHRIQVPCLMLCGEQDRHITAAASQETAQLLPDCEFHCYPNTAHLLPWEIPQQITQDIDRWLVFKQFRSPNRTEPFEDLQALESDKL